MTDETASVQGEDNCTGAHDCDAPTHIHGCFAKPTAPAPSDEALLSTINGVLMGAMYNRALQAEGAPSVSDMARAVLDAIDLPRLLAEGEAARTAEIVAWLREHNTCPPPSWNYVAGVLAAYFNPEAE